MKKSLLTLFLILFLAACSTNTSAPETPAVEVPTFTLAPTEMSSAFETFPTQPTPTRYLTSTPTPEPTRTPAPTITQTPRATAVGDFVSASPSKDWAAWEVDCDSTKESSCLKFTTVYGVRWIVEPEDFGIGENDRDGSRIELARWSADEESVYLVLIPFTMGARFYKVIGIAQFSLMDGSISFLAKPIQISRNGMYSIFQQYRYGFSNDGKWLAYMWKEEETIEFRLLNLDSGKTQKFSRSGFWEGSEFGDIAWAPDDKHIVFSISEHDMHITPIDDFSVYLLTLEDGLLDDKSIKRLYTHGKWSLSEAQWISGLEVKYEYVAWQDYEFGEVIFNIETGEMTVRN